MYNQNTGKTFVTIVNFKRFYRYFTGKRRSLSILRYEINTNIININLKFYIWAI